MNAPSLRADDSAPTLVMSTRVMDRRALPPMSGVVPVARSTSPLALVPPPIAQPIAQPVAQPSPSPASPPSADATQPSRLVRRETILYRRLTIAFCIAFAFASGLAASFAVQASAVANAPQIRPTREGQTRSASLRLVDGSDTKLSARDDHQAPAALASPVPSARAARRAAATAQPAAAAAGASAAVPAPEEPRTPDVAPSELLDKGLAAD